MLLAKQWVVGWEQKLPTMRQKLYQKNKHFSFQRFLL